jgi:L,D-transpeptidase YcbB
MVVSRLSVTPLGKSGGMMKKHIFAIGLALTTALFPAGAKAENLLDLLFGNQQPEEVIQRPKLKQQFPAAPKPVAPKPRIVAKIEPPAFLDYKPNAVALYSPDKAIQFSTASLPFGPGLSFVESFSGLENYQLSTEKPVAAALTAHYSAKPSFLWVAGFDPTENALDLARYLRVVDMYGLNPDDYAVDMPDGIWSPDAEGDRAAALIRFEISLSAAVLRYISDVEGGRIDPNRISEFYDFSSKVPDLAQGLAALAQERDPVLSLEMRHPREPEYRALVRELASLRAQGGSQVTVASGTKIKPGDIDLELPKIIEGIRSKASSKLLTDHAVTFASYDGNPLYDDGLVAIVRDWQKANGLGSDGVIGARTIATTVGLGGADKIKRVIYALEQMRWLPDAFGGRYVFINQPAFTATYYDKNVAELTTRAVVGTKKNQTYFFHDIIEYVEFNPTWGVPQSIIINEYLPKLRANPGYLDQKGFEVYTAKGEKISSTQVNWSAVGKAAPVSVIQPGGDGNALGDLKIMFPNKHSIYMHDTPARDLFAKEVRAFSHGCVRLQQPHEMAAKVLGISTAVVDERVKQPTNRLNVKNKLPVYVTYFTAWPDEQGVVQYYNDIYDRDLHLGIALEKTRAARGTAI